MVPFPGPGGLGGFWVGAPVRGVVPAFMFWALTCKIQMWRCGLNPSPLINQQHTHVCKEIPERRLTLNLNNHYIVRKQQREEEKRQEC